MKTGMNGICIAYKIYCILAKFQDSILLLYKVFISNGAKNLYLKNNNVEQKYNFIIHAFLDGVYA